MHAGLDGIAIDLPALNIKPNARRRHPDEHPDQRSALADAQHARLQLLGQARRSRTRSGSIRATASCPTARASTHHRLGKRGVRSRGARRRELRLIFKPYKDALPEHISDRLTQVRDNYANLVEESVNSRKLNLFNRFDADITDLLRVDPRQRSRAASTGMR